MGLGQYNGLGKYCGPHTASSVFLILIFKLSENVHTLKDTACQSWINYIGLKRESLTNRVYVLFFPEGGVVWNIPY